MWVHILGHHVALRMHQRMGLGNNKPWGETNNRNKDASPENNRAAS